MKRILATLAALGMIFCPPTYAEPLAINSMRVTVEPGIDDSPYVHDAIANQLRPSDDITVSVYRNGPAMVKEDTTHLIVFVSKYNSDYIDSISVYGNSWPPHDVAVDLLKISDEKDVVDRVLGFIDYVHAWQDQNPIGVK